MEIIITIKIEDGEPVKVNVEQTKVEAVEDYSQYARFFDEMCPTWSKDAESNLMFLRNQETYANDLLKAKGYLFLNEVYDMLGIPRTKAGQIVGWVYDAENPTEGKLVDFGLNKARSSKFVNGYNRSVLLDFNVKGNILDLL